MDLLSQTCRESEINPILLPSAKKRNICKHTHQSVCLSER